MFLGQINMQICQNLHLYTNNNHNPNKRPYVESHFLDEYQYTDQDYPHNNFQPEYDPRESYEYEQEYYPEQTEELDNNANFQLHTSETTKNPNNSN